MTQTKVLDEGLYRATAIKYERIYADGINSIVAAITGGSKYKFIAWLTDKTVEYDAQNKRVIVHPCLVAIDWTMIVIGGNFHDGLQSITIPNVTTSTFNVYVQFDQTYEANVPPPKIVVTDQSTTGLVIAKVKNGQVEAIANNINYILKLQNLPTVDAPWCPISDWHCAGSIAVKSPDSKDVYISFHSPDGHKLHLVLDGDVYANEGSKQLAYTDLTNVSNATVLNKVKAVDGSGSGLDADTVDGLHASSFVRSDADTVFKNVTLNLTDARLFWSRDTDAAYIEFKDYGSNQDWLTITFGDDPGQDRIRFHWQGTDGEYDVLDILNSKLISYKEVEIHGDIYPDKNNQYDIGSSSLRYKTVYATTFDGVALHAKYTTTSGGDIAEKFSIRPEDKGKKYRVVIPDTTSDYECKICDVDAPINVIGVISDNPSLIMSNDKDGVVVGLKGRVYAYYDGQLKKGDLVVATKEGKVRAYKSSDNALSVIGVVINIIDDSLCEIVLK